MSVTLSSQQAAALRDLLPILDQLRGTAPGSVLAGTPHSRAIPPPEFFTPSSSGSSSCSRRSSTFSNQQSGGMGSWRMRTPSSIISSQDESASASGFDSEIDLDSGHHHGLDELLSKKRKNSKATDAQKYLVVRL